MAKWFTALVMGMTMLLFGAAGGILGPLLPAIEREFEIDTRWSGLLFSASFAGAVIAIMASGYFADRFGKKRLFLILLAGLALAYAGYEFAPTFAILAIACLLAGALGGAMEGLCSAVVADLDPFRVDRNINLLQVAFCAGAVLAVVVAASLYKQSVSWRALYGLFALLAGLIWLMGLRMQVPSAPAAAPIRLPMAFRMLCDPALLRLAFAICLYVGSEMSLAWLISPIMQKMYDYSELRALWAVGLFWAAMGFSRLGVAMLCHRYSSLVLVRLFILGGACSYVVLLLPAGAWHLWLGIILAGTTFSGIWPLLVSLANARYPAYSGTATAVMVTSGTIGGLVGPYLATQLLHGDPAARSPLLFMAGLFAGIACVMLPLRNDSPKGKR